MATGESTASGLTGLRDAAPAHAHGKAQVFWARYFSVYDTVNQTAPYRRMVERHVEAIATARGDAVLDAGVGTGNVTVALLARGARVTGVDFCAVALDMCRRKAPAGRYLFADLSRALELESGSFDKVVCCNVIYVLAPEAQRVAVAELFRVLKPGGTMALTVFRPGFSPRKIYREAWREQVRETGLWDALRRGLRYSLATLRIVYYVRRIKAAQRGGKYTFFSPEALRALLAAAGFAVLVIEPVLAAQCLMAVARKPGLAPGR